MDLGIPIYMPTNASLMELCRQWYIKLGWKTYDDPSRWFGVAVTKQGHQFRVRGLELKNNELKGQIPRELGSLVKLKTLDVRIFLIR